MRIFSIRILIVDDNLTEALSLKQALIKIQSDVSVYLITDRRSVPSYLNSTSSEEILTDESRPDFVILHAGLPDCSAMKTLKWIRKDPRFDSTIVAMLAPEENPGERTQFDEAGADVYFVQQSNDDEFIETAKDILNYYKVASNAYDHLDQQDIEPVTSP